MMYAILSFYFVMIWLGKILLRKISESMKILNANPYAYSVDINLSNIIVMKCTR